MRLVTLAFVVTAITAVPLARGEAAEQGWQSVNRGGEQMIEGSGRIVSQARQVGEFERIDLNGMTDVEVRVGGRRPTLTIIGDDNILPLLTSKVVGGTLILDSVGSYRTRTTPRAIVTTPMLTGVSSTGSGSAEITGVMSSSIALASNGSGHFRVTGRARRLDLSLRGSGDADLSRLVALNAKAEILGTGNATVRASGALQASVIGTGTLRYLGRPRTLSSNVSGPGRIIASGE